MIDAPVAVMQLYNSDTSRTDYVIPFSMHLLSNCLPDLQDAAREIIMA
jgi:hypothetical protein